MAKVNVQALDSFHHNRWNAERGARVTMNKGEAEDLEKAGLVKILGDAEEDDGDDLVGSRKMAPLTHNKMEGKPDNKNAPVSKPSTSR